MQLMCYSGSVIALIGLSALRLPRDGLIATVISASKAIQPIRKNDTHNTLHIF